MPYMVFINKKYWLPSETRLLLVRKRKTGPNFFNENLESLEDTYSILGSHNGCGGQHSLDFRRAHFSLDLMGRKVGLV